MTEALLVSGTFYLLPVLPPIIGMVCGGVYDLVTAAPLRRPGRAVSPVRVRGTTIES